MVVGSNATLSVHFALRRSLVAAQGEFRLDRQYGLIWKWYRRYVSRDPVRHSHPARIRSASKLRKWHQSLGYGRDALPLSIIYSTGTHLNSKGCPQTPHWMSFDKGAFTVRRIRAHGGQPHWNEQAGRCTVAACSRGTREL